MINIKYCKKNNCDLELSSFVKTRFAPAPSGTIHLGNIRTALLNLIFAHQKKGKFLLRIEDTDKENVTFSRIQELFSDLTWLNIVYDEGPFKEGADKPYFQSERQEFYEKGLAKLIELNRAYRCFCTKERLDELKREQVSKKIAPRYDRQCLNLSAKELKEKAQRGESFVWRFLIDHDETVEIMDLVRGKISFELKNFSDFVICRSNKSFNFLFANFIDDIEMKITHVIRGEDHLSNGALQASLYSLFEKPAPMFIHLPLILDEKGQKLSKSNKNFDLGFLRENGFLPEAICNYLVCLGSNLVNEPKTIEEIVEAFDFSSLSTQAVKYEVKRIRELNKKWLFLLDSKVLLQKMEQQLPSEDLNELLNVDRKNLLSVINICKNSCETLLEIFQLCLVLLNGVQNLGDEATQLFKKFNLEKMELFFSKIDFSKIATVEEMKTLLELQIKIDGVGKKEIFTFIRLACTGQEQGLSINEIFLVLGGSEVQSRLTKALALCG